MFKGGFKDQKQIGTGRYENVILKLTKIEDHKVSITPFDTTSGNQSILIQFTSVDNLIYPIRFPSSIIDMNTVGLGGIMDCITVLNPDCDYIVWAFANEQYEPQGFGVTCIPYSSYTSTAALKGEEVTLTNLTYACRYKIGSQVKIVESVTAGVETYNTGTVSEIVSTTSIKVMTDNYSFYGSNLAATDGVYVLQLDNYAPLHPNLVDQQPLYPNYKPIGLIKLATIDPFPIRIVIPWIYNNLYINIGDYINNEYIWTTGMIMAPEYESVIQGTWTIANDPKYYVGAMYNTTSVDQDEIEYEISLPYGQYTTSYVYRKTSKSAKHRVEIDGSLAFQIDAYANPSVDNVVYNDTINIVTAGVHTISIKANGKNASSGGYDVFFHYMRFKREV